MNIDEVNKLLQEHDLLSFINEWTCEETWINLSPDYDLNIWWDEWSMWCGTVYPVVNGEVITTGERLRVNLDTKEVTNVFCDEETT